MVESPFVCYWIRTSGLEGLVLSLLLAFVYIKTLPFSCLFFFPIFKMQGGGNGLRTISELTGRVAKLGSCLLLQECVTIVRLRGVAVTFTCPLNLSF